MACTHFVLALSIELPEVLPEGEDKDSTLTYLRNRIRTGARYLTLPPLVTIASSNDAPWRCYPAPVT